MKRTASGEVVKTAELGLAPGSEDEDRDPEPRLERVWTCASSCGVTVIGDSAFLFLAAADGASL
jgi:hypothetical protein